MAEESTDDSDSMSRCSNDDIESCVNNYRLNSEDRVLGTVKSNYYVQKFFDDRPKLSRRKFTHVQSLVDLAAQATGAHLPFGLVERYPQPIEEPLQLKITYWSFPQDEEDIMLYANLANGGPNEYTQGLCLAESSNGVTNVLQVGFHLSGYVKTFPHVIGQLPFIVSVNFDRRKITSSSCTCPANLWCSHVVALCIHRIRYPDRMAQRLPVSESLQKLDRIKLQKFAQHLIHELTHSKKPVLPTAQDLLDQLLSYNMDNRMNRDPGAPDPTAGATATEQTFWCLDDRHLDADIEKLMARQCKLRKTNVCSDIQALHQDPPQISLEYDEFLKKRRDPEGLWNLITIVSEMIRKRDSNSIIILDLLTDKMLSHERMITWWFESKVSLFSGSSFSTAKSKTPRDPKSLVELTARYSCSLLCDQIVNLWRLCALNPNLNASHKENFRNMFIERHISVLERFKSLADNNCESGLRALDLFTGFKPALEGLMIGWNEWDSKNECLIDILFEQKATSASKSNETKKKKRNKNKANKNTENETANASHASVEKNADHVTVNKNSTNSNQIHRPQVESINQGVRSGIENVIDEINALDLDINDNAIQNHDEHLEVERNQDDLMVYYMPAQEEEAGVDDRPIAKEMPNLKDLIRINSKRVTNPIEVMYSKTEGLFAHGYLNDTEKLAVQVANEMLNDPSFPNFKPPQVIMKRRRRRTENLGSIAISEGLEQIEFICKILMQKSIHKNLVFRLALHGLELARLPAATKHLEIKLISQKLDLLYLLQGLRPNQDEIMHLREKAYLLKEGSYRNHDALTVLLIGSYIFEVFNISTTQNQSVQYGKNFRLQSSDESLGYQAALDAMSFKTTVNDNTHPLYCEAVRRQRGELLIRLLEHFKDKPESLDSILDSFFKDDVILSSSAINETSNQQSSKPREANKNKSNASQNLSSTEASSEFVHELAKKLFDRAGGSSSTTHLFRPQVSTINNEAGAVNPNLHMCTLKLALYSLNLQNRGLANWNNRTYNSLALFVIELTRQIGALAILYLCENWEACLTPKEVASFSHAASCTSDPATKRAATILALSCLKHVHALDSSNVLSILNKCEEHSIEMLEAACNEIEMISHREKVGSDILFIVARTWTKLFETAVSIQEDIDCCDGATWQNMPISSAERSGAVKWITRNSIIKPESNHYTARFPWNMTCCDNQICLDCYYKHLNYINNSFRLGILALQNCRTTTILSYQAVKEDDLIWFSGVCKFLGPNHLIDFVNVFTKISTSPSTSYAVADDLMKHFNFSTGGPFTDHNNYNQIILPLTLSCLTKCQWHISESLKRCSNDNSEPVKDILNLATDITDRVRTYCAADQLNQIISLIDGKKIKFRIQVDTKHAKDIVKSIVTKTRPNPYPIRTYCDDYTRPQYYAPSQYYRNPRNQELDKYH